VSVNIFNIRATLRRLVLSSTRTSSRKEKCKQKKSREDKNRSKEEMSRGKPDKSGRQYEKTESMKKRENQI
jgi:hypothetical protein